MRLFLLAFTIAGLPFASCPQRQGKVCTDLYAYGVSVDVTDAATGQPIDNATLTLTEGTYQETMILFPGSPGNYAGAGERAGTYTLTAAAPGHQGQTVGNIVVTADECHVKGVHLDVALQPAS